MARGVARTCTFLDDRDRRNFLELAGDLVRREVLEVHAFCLMPNHYHLLVRTPEGDLSRGMRELNGTYARRFNLRHRRVGTLWQGRYRAILVQDGEYLCEASRYIHLNPNRAKLTRPAERYRWSSYRNYVGGPTAADWVETKAILAEFHDDREEYRGFVEAGKGEKPIGPFERAAAGLVLGGEEFVRWVREKVRTRADSGLEPSLRALRREGRASPEEVEEVVERMCGDVGPARRKRLLLYAQRRHSKLRVAEIARRYGRTPAAVTLAVRDLDAFAEKDRRLAARLLAIARALKAKRPDRSP